MRRGESHALVPPQAGWVMQFDTACGSRYDDANFRGRRVEAVLRGQPGPRPWKRGQIAVEYRHHDP